ncbi:hypothetical protein CC2G_013930 [Coprinopsis cinerea AmutBmut pab1-1]|nr:hypothetical protein CC2G_013930 [Coprinopsis cinerea AmutBmut pab1-1]
MKKQLDELEARERRWNETTLALSQARDDNDLLRVQVSEMQETIDRQMQELSEYKRQLAKSEDKRLSAEHANARLQRALKDKGCVLRREHQHLNSRISHTELNLQRVLGAVSRNSELSDRLLETEREVASLQRQLAEARSENARLVCLSARRQESLPPPPYESTVGLRS